MLLLLLILSCGFPHISASSTLEVKEAEGVPQSATSALGDTATWRSQNFEKPATLGVYTAKTLAVAKGAEAIGTATTPTTGGRTPPSTTTASPTRATGGPPGRGNEGPLQQPAAGGRTLPLAAVAAPCNVTCQAAFQIATAGDYSGNDINPGPANCYSAADCEYRCYITATCLSFTWNGGSCYLHSNLGPFKIAPADWVTGQKNSTVPPPPATTAPPASSPCNATCQAAFQVVAAADYGGSDINPGPANCFSAADCEYRCYITAACLTFTWNGGSCYLHSNKGSLKLAPADWTTGARTSSTTISPTSTVPPSTSPCGAACQAAFQIATGADYSGNDINPGPVNVISAADCQSRCYGLAACLSFTWNSFSCYLHSSNGPLKTASATWTTGLKLGNATSTPPQTSTAPPVTTQAPPPTSTGSPTTTAAPPPTSTSPPAATSVPPPTSTVPPVTSPCNATCEGAFDVFAGGDYGGTDLPVPASIVSAADCQNRCFADATCVSFTWIGNGCYPHSDYTKYSQAPSDWTTGMRISTPPPTPTPPANGTGAICTAPCQAAFSISFGHDYQGNAAINYPNNPQAGAASMDACEAICYQDAKCQSFTYMPAAGCFLHTAVGAYTTTANSSVTGAKTTSAAVAWTDLAPLPTALGEVTSGVVTKAGRASIVILGQPSGTATYVYDIAAGTYFAGAQRPFAGDHHAGEVINNKLFLFGGLNGYLDTYTAVQIYNPDSDTWSLGAAIPAGVGSASTAYINGIVYLCGGIDSSYPGNTTSACWTYNVTANAWASMAAMPQGVNHAAAGTDGSMLYIFGGRDGGNLPAPGYNYLQIYSPNTGQWQSSVNAGNKLQPLPAARGGMGKAVWFNGEFYIMGGETSLGPSTALGITAKQVYTRVDVYSPTLNTWRRAADMSNARHGIFPVLSAANSLMYVIGGGEQSGAAQTSKATAYKGP